MILFFFDGVGGWRALVSRAAARLRRAADALIGLTGNNPRREEPDPAALVRAVRTAVAAHARKQMARLIGRTTRTPRLPPPRRDGGDREPGA